MSNLGYQTSIPTRELSSGAIDAIYNSLMPRGFDPQSMIESNFAFTDREGRKVKTNLLAFTHKTFRSPDYTGLTVFSPANGISDEQLAQTLAQSAAPFHIIHRYDTQRFSFWFTSVTDRDAQNVQTQRVASDIEYSQLNQVISAYAGDVEPQRITDVKRGRDFFRHFEHTGAFQLALWAIDVTGDGLVQHFGQAVESLRQNNVPSSIITDLSTQLLGATILSHTGTLGSNLRQNDTSLDTLITVAHQHYPSYFDINNFARWHHAASEAYSILTELSYANFSPELLTRLYQEAYPDVAQRRELGRYDTPLYLTRKIWETIPIEFLPPDQRVVADMTCGWGSFLISAHERLSRMIDMEEYPLRDYIYGNDNEPFTAKLAGLGLLVSTLQDSWHISDQDALNWHLPNSQPNIIVGNPPFHGSRKEPSTEHSESAGRFERANLFLDHAIDILAPEGYLAMLMPQSFVAAEASPVLRKKLIETCDVLEMWELPIGIFPDAQANSLLMLVRKKSEIGLSHYPVRVRTVQTRQYDDFKEQGTFTASSVVNSQSQWDEHSRRSRYSQNTHIFDYQFILPQFTWETIRSHCVELQSKATIFTGTIPGKAERRRHINDPNGKPVQWITKAQNVIYGSFQIIYNDPQTLTYPNDFEEPRLDNEEFLRNSKVLMNALANPSWGKRVKAVIDRRGFFVSNNFIVLAPKDNEPYLTLEALAAIVDWKVSNAWLLEHLKHTKFPMRTILNLPCPSLTGEECTRLTQAVLEIENAWSHEEERPLSAVQAIDDTLRNAYQLDDETYERLTLITEWDSASPVTLDRQFDPSAQWEISGIVDNVDAENGEITFWLDGFDELQSVPIVPVMPGWLLRPEVAFCTSIPRSCVSQRSLLNNVSWGFFKPQNYTYLNEDEAFEELARVLS